jgi:hypothetical protein
MDGFKALQQESALMLNDDLMLLVLGSGFPMCLKNCKLLGSSHGVHVFS